MAPARTRAKLQAERYEKFRSPPRLRPLSSPRSDSGPFSARPQTALRPTTPDHPTGRGRPSFLLPTTRPHTAARSLSVRPSAAPLPATDPLRPCCQPQTLLRPAAAPRPEGQMSRGPVFACFCAPHALSLSRYPARTLPDPSTDGPAQATNRFHPHENRLPDLQSDSGEHLRPLGRDEPVRRHRRRQQQRPRECGAAQLHRAARTAPRAGGQHPRPLRPHARRGVPQTAVRHPLRPLVEGPLPARERLGERLGIRGSRRSDAHGGHRPRDDARASLRADDPARHPHAGPHAGPRGALRAAVEGALHGRHALPRVDWPHGPARRRLLVDYALDSRAAAAAGRRGARLSGPRTRDDAGPRDALQPLHRRGAQPRGENRFTNCSTGCCRSKDTSAR